MTVQTQLIIIISKVVESSYLSVRQKKQKFFEKKLKFQVPKQPCLSDHI